ncbi:MAG: tetratricopeptide repeat protein [Mariniblastus sp.]|nr:tetratricopeptide repeat protein [Mariniblastus sp.]
MKTIFLMNAKSLLISWLVGLATLLSGAVWCHAQTVNDQYGLAAGYYARAQYGEAIPAFQSIIKNYPNSELAAVSHFFLGESYVQEKEYAKAYPAYQQFLVLLPGHKYSARAQFRMGESAYRLGYISEAATLLEAFTRAYPNQPLHEFSLPYLGQVRLKRNEPQLAQRTFEQALETFPHGEMANQCRLGLADSLLAQGAVDEAARFYEFIKAQTGNPFVGEAALALGKIWFQRNDVNKARFYLQDAVDHLSLTPKLTESKYWLARCDMESGEFSASVSTFQSIVDQPMPRDMKAAVLFDGAIAAFKTNALELAETWLLELQQKWPDTRWAESALAMRADVAYSERDWEAALELVEQFELQYPESVDRMKMEDLAGRIYYEQEDYDRTVQTFKSLLRRSNESPGEFSRKNRNVWNYFVGLGLVGKKEYETAIEILESVQLDPTNPDLQSALAIARATALVGLDRSDESIYHLQKYLELQPTGVHALRSRADLAVALTQGGKWKQANRAASDLVQNHVDEEITWATLYYMAETALNQQQLELAQSWFSLLSKRGSSPEYREHGDNGLFWVASQQNRPHLAGALFERMRENYPASPRTCEAAMIHGKQLEEGREYTQAVEVYQFVHEGFPGTPLAAMAIVRHAYNLHKIGGEENLEAAHEILQDYVEQPGQQGAVDEATYMLAWICLDRELKTESLAWFEKLIEQYPESPFWVDSAYRVSTVMVEQEKYPVAVELLSRASERELKPAVMSSVLYLQGQIAAKQKEWSQVTASMEQLLTIAADPKVTVKARYWLAESLYRQEKYDVAETIFQELCADEQLGDPSLRPWIQLRLAQCLVHLEHWSQVLKIANRCLQEESDFEAIYEFEFLAGRALSALGKLDDARTSFEKVVQSERGKTTETAAIAQWRIGETYFHQQDYKQAIAAYYRVDSLYGYDRWRAAALIQAGKCQEHLGNWKHAVKLYQQLIKDFPQSEFRVDAETRLQVAMRQAKADTSGRSR